MFAQMACMPALVPAGTKPTKIVFKNVDSDGVMDVIFAPDDLTGLPNNALAVFLSDKANPKVRDYIASQLMNVNEGQNPQVPDGISDADLFALTRQRNEPLADYVDKVNGYMQQQKAMFEQSVKAERLAQMRVARQSKSE